MKEIKIEDLVYVTEKHTDVYTNTRIIANVTGLEHSYIMKKCRRLADAQQISHDNIIASNYQSRGKNIPMYQLDKAGTMALLLSFKGKKYDKLRLAIANKFIDMQKELECWRGSRNILKEDTKTLHDALKPLSDALKEMYPESKKGGLLYNHIHKKVNKAVLGKGTGTDRDILSVDDINRLDMMEYNLKTLLDEWRPYNPMAVRGSVFKWIEGKAS